MEANVGIVGYRMGNVGSLRNALAALGADSFVADEPARLREATHVILPGVGAFPQAMQNLRGMGFEPVLRELALHDGRPLLGVCLGMQLLASTGEEHETCSGLGFIPGRVTMLTPADGLRVPHIGWNDTVATRENPLLPAADAARCFYYVHSYHFVPEAPEHAIMSCDHGGIFISGVQRRNVMGVQFHPEKSHAAGLGLLKRFLEFRPC